LTSDLEKNTLFFYGMDRFEVAIFTVEEYFAELNQDLL